MVHNFNKAFETLFRVKTFRKGALRSLAREESREDAREH